MSVAIPFETLEIRVRPSPETNSHEVQLIGDGDDLIERFWDGMIGLDPTDILLDPSLLDVGTAPHRATVARCVCGVIGCGSVEVEVRIDGDHVLWTDHDRVLRFHARQYANELARAKADTSWETPERTAARLVRAAVNRKALAGHGLSFEWASGRVTSGQFTASLRLDPGPYQILVTVPWIAEGAEEIATAMLEVLQSHPRSWQSATYIPQSLELGPPAMRGPRWRRW